MPKGAKTARDVMKFLVCGAVPEWITSGERYVGLHTADPTDGDQDTSEVAYYGYRRQPIPVTGWDSDAETMANHDFLDFAVNAGSATPQVTHVSIGTAETGPGQIIYVAKMRSPRSIRSNQKPRFEAGEIIITEA